jgi:phosphopantothenoylcysteine decarboxylase/phosphopantothenate--cysteine ligase
MKPLRILITAGPTHEPIDAVRYIGNRSSGRMGAAIAEASLAAGHQTTLIVGPVSVPMPSAAKRIDIETAAQLQSAVLENFPAHDLLIMAAAVADFRPKSITPGKLDRADSLIIECEPTEDIVAATARRKRPDQRIIGFALEADGGVDRATKKLQRKALDLIVFNPAETMNSPTVGATLIYPDGRSDSLPARPKSEFAALLLARASLLFP